MLSVTLGSQDGFTFFIFFILCHSKCPPLVSFNSHCCHLTVSDLVSLTLFVLRHLYLMPGLPWDIQMFLLLTVVSPVMCVCAKVRGAVKYSTVLWIKY